MLTTGEIAARLRAPVWLVRNLIDAEFSAHVMRLGTYRGLPAHLLPQVEAALGVYRSTRAGRRRRRAKAVPS
jgi:hypothetical protein